MQPVGTGYDQSSRVTYLLPDSWEGHYLERSCELWNCDLGTHTLTYIFKYIICFSLSTF